MKKLFLIKYRWRYWFSRDNYTDDFALVYAKTFEQAKKKIKSKDDTLIYDENGFENKTIR